jgi:hypothetical protein
LSAVTQILVSWILAGRGGGPLTARYLARDAFPTCGVGLLRPC